MRVVLIQYRAVFIRIVSVLLLCVGSGCTEYYALEPEPAKWPCKPQGACDAAIMYHMKKLNQQGVTVLSVGQDYLISIPAAYLFANQSPRMKWRSYALLNQVAVFLKQFRKVSMHVTTHGSKYVSPARERALSLARSRVVSEYLWSQGVDSRFIFAQGLGSDKPILAYPLGGDRSANARVDITFRNAVA